MIPDYIRIETGQLFIVDRGFWTSGNEKDGGFKCKRFMPKGEVLEIRYPYAWHFRTSNNTYDHVDPKILKSKCSFFGVIHNDIRFNNKHKLKEILEENLYHSPLEYKIILKDG